MWRYLSPALHSESKDLFHHSFPFSPFVLPPFYFLLSLSLLPPYCSHYHYFLPPSCFHYQLLPPSSFLMKAGALDCFVVRS